MRQKAINGNTIGQDFVAFTLLKSPEKILKICFSH